MSESDRDEICRLVDDFVEDADGMSEQELTRLAGAVSSDPTLAERLSSALRIDELLRQQYSTERGDFFAQVRQRVLDHQRGESELDLRTEELRRLALGQLARPAAAQRRRPNVLTWASLASVLLVAACAALAGVFGLRGEVARIAIVSGDAILERGGERRLVVAGETLAVGDAIEVAGGEATIVYDDETSVELSSHSKLLIESGRGKQLWLDAGELAANIAPQPDNRPMVFRTPAAQAVVVGTQLRLRASDEETELEVIEGAVEFALVYEGAGGAAKPRTVSASQTAIANRQGLALQSAAWPLYREGLILLAPTGNDEGLSRDALTNRFGAFRFTARGAARFDNARAIRFEGGAIHSRQAGANVVALCRRANALSLEVIFRALEWKDDADSVLIAAAGPAAVNFELSRVGEWLHWKVLSAGEQREVRLAPLTEGEPTHLVIAMGEAGTTVFFNGRSVFEEATLNSEFERWTAGPLYIGGDGAGARPFHGELLGAAIYDRAFTRDEAQASSRRLPVDAALP